MRSPWGFLTDWQEQRTPMPAVTYLVVSGTCRKYRSLLSYQKPTAMSPHEQQGMLCEFLARIVTAAW
jgi:hypothetical protein